MAFLGDQSVSKLIAYIVVGPRDVTVPKLTAYEVIGPTDVTVPKITGYAALNVESRFILSQLGIEAWAAGAPNVVLTQIGLEVWAQITPANVIATQVGLEAWVSVRAAPRGGPIISLIM